MATEELKVYLVGKSSNSFRRGEPALVTGVKMVKPGKAFGPRICLMVEYEDGKTDAVPLVEVPEIYEFKTLDQIIEKKK